MASKNKQPANVRRQAIEILGKVDAGAHADNLLGIACADRPTESARAQSDADTRLLREIVMGTLTWRARLDYHLNAYLKKPIARLQNPVRNILRTGAYQILFLDRVPGYAVVSECVDLARRFGKGVSGLTNAVLRGLAENRVTVNLPNLEDQPVEHLAVQYSHPHWLVSRWIKRIGYDRARELCEAGNTRSPIVIRVNPARTTLDALVISLDREGIQTSRITDLFGFLKISVPSGLFGTTAFEKGWFSVQGPGAGRVSRLLDAKPGDRILDVCAAPGGKTMSAAEQGNVQVYASDASVSRLKALSENRNRLGLNIRILASDARALPYTTPFDHVLVDAPCTGLGTLSRNPEIRWHRHLEDIDRMARLQIEILSGAARHVADRGALIYTTCSTEPEENEQVIDRFLNKHPDFHLDPDGGTEPILSILPGLDGSDGAFGARLRKLP